MASSYLDITINGKQENGLVDIVEFTLNNTTQTDIKLYRAGARYTGQENSGSITFKVGLNTSLYYVLTELLQISADVNCEVSSDICKSSSVADNLVSFIGSIGIGFDIFSVEIAKAPELSREAEVINKTTIDFKINFVRFGGINSINL